MAYSRTWVTAVGESQREEFVATVEYTELPGTLDMWR